MRRSSSGGITAEPVTRARSVAPVFARDPTASRSAATWSAAPGALRLPGFDDVEQRGGFEATIGASPRPVPRFANVPVLWPPMCDMGLTTG